MKIKVNVVHVTEAEYDTSFPVYIQNVCYWYCYYDPKDIKKYILITDMSIGKGVEYFSDHASLENILGNANSKIISKEQFQNKLVEILSIINGAVDEMHKADEQQKDS